MGTMLIGPILEHRGVHVSTTCRILTQLERLAKGPIVNEEVEAIVR